MSFIFTTDSTRPVRKEKVVDWAGNKKPNKYTANSSCKHQSVTTATNTVESTTTNWEDVSNNVQQMDQSYDATFYAWLKSEENVLVTSIYLHRIANEYTLDRISNALEWLTTDWRWENVLMVVQHVTIDWSDEDDLKRAELLKIITHQWSIQYTATLISNLLMSSPYNNNVKKRERFLKAFTHDWDFSKLSELFMVLKSKANIDYKFKCHLLQEAAKKDKFDSSSCTLSSETATHHKRTNSKDVQETKKATSSSSTSTTTARYHLHAPPTRLNSSSSSLTISTSSSSSSSTASDKLPSPSTSSASTTTNNSNSDTKKRLSHCSSSSTDMKPIK